MAGAAGTVVTYPMETLRTHMALGGQSYRECLADVLRTHGRRGLYKGFTSGVVRLADQSFQRLSSSHNLAAAIKPVTCTQAWCARPFDANNAACRLPTHCMQRCNMSCLMPLSLLHCSALGTA